MNRISEQAWPQANADALLTPDRLAELLGIRKSTLARWRAREGVGPPFIRISANRVGYPVEAYRRWLKARTEN